MKATIGAPPVHRVALTQLLLLLILATLAMIKSVPVGYSVLIGGIIQVVPHAYFTWMAYRYSGARQAPNMLRAMYRGETGKLLLTVVMFALVFAYIRPISLPALFLGYSGMIVVQWFSAAKILNQS